LSDKYWLFVLNGVDMCIYKYGNDRCAHPSNLSIECVGEEHCTLLEEDEIKTGLEINKENKFESEENTINLKNLEGINECDAGYECSNTKCGIYCQKYKRFYCSGKDNCQTEDDYFEHMNQYGGIDIEKRPDI